MNLTSRGGAHAVPRKLSVQLRRKDGETLLEAGLCMDALLRLSIERAQGQPETLG